jgi:hypothetical protein
MDLILVVCIKGETPQEIFEFWKILFLYHFAENSFGSSNLKTASQNLSSLSWYWHFCQFNLFSLSLATPLETCLNYPNFWSKTPFPAIFSPLYRKSFSALSMVFSYFLVLKHGINAICGQKTFFLVLKHGIIAIWSLESIQFLGVAGWMLSG